MNAHFPLIRSLSIRVTLFTLAIFLLCIWSLVFYASKALRADMQRLLSDQQFAAVSMAAAEINLMLDIRLRALNQMADQITPSRIQNQSQLQTDLNERAILLGYFNNGLFVVDRQGLVVASSPGGIAAGTDLSARADIVTALNEGLGGVSGPMPGKVSPYPRLAMLAPIHSNQGEIIGALVGETDLSSPNFLDNIADAQYGKTGGYGVASLKHKRVITSFDKSRIMQSTPTQGLNKTMDRFLQGYEGSAIVVNGHGQEVLVSTKNIPLANWIVGAQLPTKEAFAPIDSLQRRMLFAALLLTLLSIGLIWWLLARELRPLLAAARALRRQTEAGTPLRPLPVGTQDEIGTLIRGFNQLLANLAQREELLNNSEQRYRTLVEWSLEAIWVHRNGTLLYVNPATVALFEAESAEDLVGTHLLDFLDPKFHALVRSRIKQTTESQAALPLFEQQFITRKGNLIDLEVQVTAIDYDGQPATQSVMRNITQRKSAEEALRMSEARFRRIMESGMIGMMFWDASGNITQANDTFLNLLGYTQEDIKTQGLSWRQITPPEFAHLDEQALHEIAVKGTCTPFEKAYYHRNGRLVPVLVGGASFDEGATQGVAFNLDLTQRNQAEEALRVSEANLAITLNSIGDAVIATNAEGKVIRMNPTAELLTGWGLGDAIGRPLSEVFNILDANTRAPSVNPVQLVMECNAVISLANHTSLISRTGQEYQIFDSAAPIRDPNGEIVGVVLVFSDVTEDYGMRRSLERTTEMLQRTGEMAKVGAWELDLRTMELAWSRAAYSILEHEEDVVLTFDNAISMFVEESRAQIEQSMQETIATGVPFVGEVPGITAKGRSIWIKFYGAAVYEDGKPILVRGAFQDTTETKQVEERLRLSEQKLATTLNSIGDAVIATDDQGRITRMNPTAERLTGWSFEDAKDRDLAEVFRIVDAQSRIPCKNPVQQVMDGGQVVGLSNHTTLISRDQHEYHIADSAAPIRDENDKVLGVVLVFSDVTEKYRIQEALKRSEASMVAAQARAHFGNWELDLQTMTGYWSAENFRFYGLPPEGPVPPFADFLDLLHPEDRAKVIEVNTSVPHTTEPVVVEFRTNPERCPPRVIQSTLEVIRDYTGRPLMVVGTSLDITERKQFELALQNSLHEKEALLKEVHHRVKNNLQVINSLLRLEISRNQLAGVKDVLGDMQGRIRSMALLHETLYRSGTFAAVDLGVYLKQLADHAFRTLNVQAQVKLQLDLASIHVEMDQALPCGLLVNELISNCLKHAFPHGQAGTVSISLKMQQEAVVLTVSDDGVGLPADFDLARSQSLGLQLVSDLAKQLGGKLSWGPNASFVLVFNIKNPLLRI